VRGGRGEGRPAFFNEGISSNNTANSSAKLVLMLLSIIIIILSKKQRSRQGEAKRMA
jgi:hypothetical protein